MTLRLTAFFQHMPPYSGAAALRGQSIIAGLSSLMQMENGQLAVYCTTPNSTPISGALIEKLDVPEVENSLGLKQRFLGEIRMGYVAAKRMFRDQEKPTLAVVSSPGYISALVQTFFARRHGIPYILEMRDVYPQVYSEAKLIRQNSLLYKFFQHMSRTMYSKAELVVCATQGLAREVAHEAPSTNVIHVYNGFPASFAERRPQKYQRFTVCFHGVLGFFQDIETVLKVTEQLGSYDVDVVVIGYGRKEEILKASDLPNLRFLGRQTFDRTIAEVERCHLGLCLRLNDGISKDAFPVKVWEYLGLGIPCIVTPPCEAGQFLEQNACGIVLESGDVEGIVAAVLRAKNESDQLTKMIDNCRRLSANFTREQTGLAAAQEIYKAALKYTHTASKPPKQIPRQH